MSSILGITSKASDLNLLTIAELREAAGISDGSQDDRLRRLGSRVSAAITAACKVASAGAVPPTLRQETLVQTVRQARAVSSILLARRPVVTVNAVTENDVALEPSDYELEASAGELYRLSGSSRICWPSGIIAVGFSAGWETVPEDLKLAASKLAQTIWAEAQRGDPALKRVDIPGLGEREYWVAPSEDPLMPAEVMDLLSAGGYVLPTIV